MAVVGSVTKRVGFFVRIFVQGGPLPVISRVLTPLIGVISYNPSYPFIRPFMVVITPFIYN